MSEPIALTAFAAEHNRIAQRQGRALLNHPKLEEVVPEIPALELYHSVKSIGLRDAAPVLAASTPEQIRAFVDIEGWDGDVPSIEDIDEWLGAFQPLGPDKPTEAFNALDQEVQLLWLRHHLTIHVVDEDNPPPELPKGWQRRETPDNNFLLDCPDDEERALHPFTVVDGLYRQDISLGFKTITAVDEELPTPLQEQAFQWRQGRLMDMGIPSRIEALRAFSKPNPNPPQAPRQTRSREALVPYVGMIPPDSWFGEVLQRVSDRERVYAIGEEMTWLVNHALVAYDIELGSPTRVREGLANAAGLVQLGVEVLLRDPTPIEAWDDDALSDAAALFDAQSLFELHRHGAHKARTLIEEELGAVDPALMKQLGEMGDVQLEAMGAIKADAEFLLACAQKPVPLHAVNPDERPRGFHSLRGLYDAQARIRDLRARLKPAPSP